MKYLSTLVLLLWAMLGLQAQDTVRFTGCTVAHPSLTPLKASNIRVNIENWGTYSVPTGPASHCAGMQVSLTGLPANTHVYVDAEKSNFSFFMKASNGVSVGDLMRLEDYLLGLSPLSTPYMYSAADVNKSGSVTTFDITEMRKVILRIYSEWPNLPVWRFIPETYKLPDPSQPFSQFPGSLTLDEFREYDGDTMRVYGVKVGDLDGDANFDVPYDGPPNIMDTLYLRYPGITLKANTLTEIPIYLEKGAPIAGLQAEFTTLGKIPLDGFSEGSVFINSTHYSLLGTDLEYSGIVVTAHPQLQSGAPLFYLRAASPVDVVLDEKFLQLSHQMPALGFSTGGVKPYRLLLRYDKNLSADPAPPTDYPLQVSPASPNPFTDQAIIEVQLPESLSVLLEVFDAQGRLTHSAEQTLGSGRQQVRIPAEAVAPGSMGLYRIRAGAGVAVGKVVRR